MVWFLISEKNYPRVHACTKSLKQGKHKNCIPKFPILSAHELPSRGLVVFKDMNTYLCTEGWNLKTFLKEYHAVTLDGCYLFTRKY